MSSLPILYQNSNTHDKLLSIYCLIDDLLKLSPEKYLPPSKGRNSNVTTPEILTLIVFFYEMGFVDWKHFYQFLENYHPQDFNLPHYKNFVVQINYHLENTTQLLGQLTKAAAGNSTIPISIADSSPLPVCTNKRIFDHKVCDGFATRGKSSLGYFFGFKIHIITDLEGNLQNVRITTANTDDRIPIVSMVSGINCMLLIADAGYISSKLSRFLAQMGIWYLTCVRRNMKNVMTWWQSELLKKRQIVEVVFSVLKYRMGMVSSLPRSVLGHMARYVHTCFAYQVRRLLMSNLNTISKFAIS